MKLVGVLALVILVSGLLLASPIAAQEEKCYLGTTDVFNTVQDSTTHAKIVLRFFCSNASEYEGQITKALINVPFTDITNLGISDPFGSLKVSEGPSYFSQETRVSETTIGVIFRQGLLITEEETTYNVAIEFDTNSLVSKDDSTFSLKTKDLLSNPKITVVSKGITEVGMGLDKINYELTLPTNANVKEIKPKGCTLSSSVIECKGIETSDFNSIEVSWTASISPITITNKIKDITQKLLPAVTGLLGGGIKKVIGIFNK